MDDFVNNLVILQREIQGSGITFRIQGDHLQICGLPNTFFLRIIRLYRPSSDEVKRNAAPDVVLVLSAASEKAINAAAQYNYILVPGGGCRIVAPGIAIVHDSKPTAKTPRQVQLQGRTGVLVESLLLDSDREWSVRELASVASVSPALAHRVMIRLEHENLLTSYGLGREKTRVVHNPKALAELWSQEEKPPTSVLRGFLYSASHEELARKVLDVYPDGAVGGALAANMYQPVLTRVVPPIRIWVSSNFNLELLTAIGFEQTTEGANVELALAKDDAWRIHRTSEKIPRVSKWRAWVEVSTAKGRTAELADALLSDLGDK